MHKTLNKGMTLIEIILSVAIFAILMCPIVSKLIQSMKVADDAKTAQNRYELVENMMEHIKTSDDFNAESTAKSNEYFSKITDGGTVNSVPLSGSVTGSESTESYDGYILTGTTKIGKKNEVYNYAVKVDNESYAKRKSNDNNYDDPNQMTLATVEDLDARNIALINGTISNYDITVTKAFMSQKLDVLKVADHNRWEQYTKQQADIVAFPNDSVTRVIEIAVTEDSNKEYTVTCTLRYKENSNLELKDGDYEGHKLSEYLTEVSYVPYEQTFKDKLPNIYLMYNPCLYNNNYMANDYIVLDTSGMKNEKEAEVNLFVVETAEYHSDTAYKAYEDVTGEKYVDENNNQKSLINMNAVRDREDVKVHIIGKKGISMVSDPENVHIYSNFEQSSGSSSGGGTTTTEEPKNKKNKDILLDNTVYINDGLGTTVYDIDTYDVNNNKLTKCYSIPAASHESLSGAIEAATSLYDVKIYITKESLTSLSADELTAKLDTLTPQLTGTKGGK